MLIEATGLLLALLLLHALRLPEVWRDPNAALWGNTAADALKHVWTLWHVAWSWAHGNGLGTSTELVRFPEGGLIWPASPIEATLLGPLTLGMGAVWMYNALQAAHFVLAGAGYYALARHWSASVPAALAVTPVFALSGGLICTIANGNIGASQAFWLPWTAVATLHALRNGRLSSSLLAGALLGLSAISNIYIGISTGVVLLGVGWVYSTEAPGLEIRRRVATIVGVGLLLAAPFLGYAGTLLETDQALITKPANIVTHMRALEGAAAIESFLRPGVNRGLDPTGQVGTFIHASAFGWAAALLGLWAIVRGGRKARRLGGLLLVGVLMALGPRLKIGNGLFLIGDLSIPLPYAVLDWVPPFDMLIELWRFSIISQFALGLLLLEVLRTWSRRTVLLVGALLWAEALWLTPGPDPWSSTPLKDREIARLFKGTASGPVLHFPLRQGTWPLYYQTLHHQPIANTPEMAGDPGLFELIRQRNWRPDELRNTLEMRGYRWFVLHTRDEMEELQQVDRLANSLRKSGAVVAERPDLLLADLALTAEWGDARYRSRQLDGRRSAAPATFRPTNEEPTSPRPMAEPGLLPPDRHTPSQ